MKNWPLVIIAVILVVGITASGYFYYQGSKNLNDAQAQIANLKQDVSALKSSLSAQQGNIPQTFPSYGATTTSTIAKIGPVVVRIDVTAPGVRSSGSGTIIDKRGYVLTNYHVIDQATSIKVTLTTGEAYDAAVVKSDQTRDVALLKITSNRTDFPEAVLGLSG